ncbi:hypothetical protein K461DRAFT_67090 [Myriangium duriaei CBS 260.36]|uniref:Uncharacterized protein n=1 Tax=Myriangium duriaei CBS 260.36 TaxID=1168546 RepID=A0A9P4ITC9_9PEZI|nr:hypothetical protein K461DRAFT_67090 [Myriangium duriaei CBS 260.36]
MPMLAVDGNTSHFAHLSSRLKKFCSSIQTAMTTSASPKPPVKKRPKLEWSQDMEAPSEVSGVVLDASPSSHGQQLRTGHTAADTHLPALSIVVANSQRPSNAGPLQQSSIQHAVLVPSSSTSRAHYRSAQGQKDQHQTTTQSSPPVGSLPRFVPSFGPVVSPARQTLLTTAAPSRRTDDAEVRQRQTTTSDHAFGMDGSDVKVLHNRVDDQEVSGKHGHIPPLVVGHPGTGAAHQSGKPPTDMQHSSHSSTVSEKEKETEIYSPVPATIFPSTGPSTGQPSSSYTSLDDQGSGQALSLPIETPCSSQIGGTHEETRTPTTEPPFPSADPGREGQKERVGDVLRISNAFIPAASSAYWEDLPPSARAPEYPAPAPSTVDTTGTSSDCSSEPSFVASLGASDHSLSMGPRSEESIKSQLDLLPNADQSGSQHRGELFSVGRSHRSFRDEQNLVAGTSERLSEPHNGYMELPSILGEVRQQFNSRSKDFQSPVSYLAAAHPTRTYRRLAPKPTPRDLAYTVHHAAATSSADHGEQVAPEMTDVTPHALASTSPTDPVRYSEASGDSSDQRHATTELHSEHPSMSPAAVSPANASTSIDASSSEVVAGMPSSDPGSVAGPSRRRRAAAGTANAARHRKFGPPKARMKFVEFNQEQKRRLITLFEEDPYPVIGQKSKIARETGYDSVKSINVSDLFSVRRSADCIFD